MRRATTALRRLAAALAAFCCGIAAFAQDGASGDTAPAIEVSAREGVTLLDAGKAVTDARAAYVADGASPKDAERGAAAADANGRIRLPFNGPGGVILVWAPGRAPVAIRVNAPIPFDVVMTAGIATPVRVTDPAGRPVGGAEVAAEATLPLVFASDGASPVHRMRVTATTAADGSVRFDGMPDLGLSVTAHAEGYVDAAAFPVDARRGATLVLGRGSRVAGTLRLLPGPAPVRGVTAHLGPRRTPVAEDGTFAFEVVPPGPWDLTFDGAGIAPPSPKTLVLADGTDRVGLEATAFRTSEFRGRVVLPERTPPPPLRIVFVYPPEIAAGPRESFAIPAADGRFAVADLPPAEGVTATVASPLFVTVRVAGISLPPGESSREHEVTLVEGGALTGRVLDLDGGAVAGATIVACEGPPPFRGAEWARAVTEADGRFFLAGLPAGPVWLRLPGRPIGSDAAIGPVTLDAAARKDTGDLRIFAGWPLAGRVPGAPDGTVVVVTRDRADIARADVVSEAFAVDGLPAGVVELRVETGGEVVGASHASLPSAWPVTLPFEPPVLVSGRIVDAQHAPVAVARLRAERLDRAGRRDADVRDPEGRFQLRLPRGRWRFEASAAATGESAAIDVTLPGDADREVVVVLDPGADLRGEVAAAENGRRIEGALVRALGVGDDRSLASARTDASGRFELHGVPPGIVRLRIETADRGVHLTGPHGVRERDTVDFGLIEIAAGVVARIEVVGVGGAPLPGAEVVLESDGGTLGRATTDAYGRAVLTGLPPGAATLTVRAEGGLALRTERVEVPRTWQDWTLRLDIASVTRVRGRVSTGARDEPFARVVLRLSTPRAVEVAVVADAGGLYELPPVPAGIGVIEVTVAGASSGYAREVRVESGREQTIDVALPESTVSGVVTAYDGTGAAGAWVELRRPDDGALAAAAAADNDGLFRLPRVPPGIYDLVAGLRGHGTAWLRDVAVRRGGDTPDLRAVLAPDARIALRAVDAQGRPVSTAWALARPVRGHRLGSEDRDDAPDRAVAGAEISASADLDGRIVLDGMSAGPWRIAVGAPGAARAELGIVAVGEGERALGDVPLRRGGVLRVVAVESGTASLRVTGLAVEVRDLYGLDPRRGERDTDPLRGADGLWVTASDGSIEIPGLAAGTYRVFVRGLPSSAIRVRVREGEATETLLPVPLGPPDE